MAEHQSRFGVVPASVMTNRKLTHAGFRLYAIMCSYADRSGRCWPSKETLTASLHTDDKSLRRLLAQLTDLGLLTKVERKSTGGRSLTNIYKVHIPDAEPTENSADIGDFLDEGGARRTSPARGGKVPPVKAPSHGGARRPPKHTKEHTSKNPPLPSGVTPKGGKPAQASLIPLPEAPPAKAAKAPDLFPEFWKAYPKKIAKGRAEPAYRRALRHATHDQIMDGVARVTATWEANGTPPQYRKAPEAWLNGKCWEDEQYLDGPSRPAFPRYETSGDVAVRVARDLMNPHSSTTVIPFPYATGAFDDEDDGREVLEGTHHRVPDQTASRL